ncbi:response regulator [Actinoallomurus bryophytorum]
MVEDDPGDQLLIQEAFAEHTTDSRLEIVSDGEDALNFVHRTDPHAEAPRPDLVLLDLNLPRFDGRAVLRALKADENLRSIPVVIFTTSSREEDVSGTYELHANAFITKPVDFDDFSNVVQRINSFFTRVARLPRPPEAA